MNIKNVPVSEQHRYVAQLWAEANAATSLLEELKRADLEQRTAWEARAQHVLA
jgi:hypothetical protein